MGSCARSMPEMETDDICGDDDKIRGPGMSVDDGVPQIEDGGASTQQQVIYFKNMKGLPNLSKSEMQGNMTTELCDATKSLTLETSEKTKTGYFDDFDQPFADERNIVPDDSYNRDKIEEFMRSLEVPPGVLAALTRGDDAEGLCGDAYLDEACICPPQTPVNATFDNTDLYSQLQSAVESYAANNIEIEDENFEGFDEIGDYSSIINNAVYNVAEEFDVNSTAPLSSLLPHRDAENL